MTISGIRLHNLSQSGVSLQRQKETSKETTTLSSVIYFKVLFIMKKIENKIKKACANYIKGYNRASAMYIANQCDVVRNLKF